MTDMKALIGKLGAILAFTTLILGGCGGGGGGGGGVSPPPPPPPIIFGILAYKLILPLDAAAPSSYPSFTAIFNAS